MKSDSWAAYVALLIAVFASLASGCQDTKPLREQELDTSAEVGPDIEATVAHSLRETQEALAVTVAETPMFTATPDLEATVAFAIEATQSAFDESQTQTNTELTTTEIETSSVQLPDIAPDPLATSEVLWADDFEDGIGESWTVVFGEWRTSNGYLLPTDDKSNSLIAGGDPEWTDYTVTVTINQFSDLYYAGGIIVRMQDPQNFMRASAYDSVLSHGTNWQVVVDGEAEDIPGTQVSRPMGRPPYDLTIVVEGQKYQLFVDGELQSVFTDTTFDRGYLGLQSFGYQGLPSNPHLAGFDNLIVTRDK